jgi:CubicO group peptidase (beta-lactamase class C family)
VITTSGDDLDVFIRARMESAHVPGLALAIIRDGTLVRAAGFGYANLAQRRPMQADMLINIASITKTATCTAVMQLWEQKKFALHDDVNAYLPFLVRHPMYAHLPVTFRQLLTHTSSIADGPAYGDSYACGDSRTPLGRWLRDYLSADGALFDRQRNFHPWQPCAQFRYSNVAYGLLGYLVETISDMSYPDYMRKRVFAPLGMSHSRFSLDGMDPKSHATAYTFVKDGDFAAVNLRDPAWVPPTDGRGGVQVPHCLYSFATPSDGLARTSAEELSRLLQAYMNEGLLDGQRVLQSETVAQILSDQHVPFANGEPAAHRQGLAWRRFDDSVLGTTWGHSGADPGISTLMTFRPKDRRGVIVLTNSSEGVETVTEIARRVFAE